MNADDRAAVNEAFMYACHLQHAAAAAPLLDRAIALDAGLGRQIDGGPGRFAFVQYFIENKPDVHNPDPFEPWKDFVKQQVDHAMRDGDMTTFVERIAARTVDAVRGRREIPGKIDRVGSAERPRSFTEHPF
jgi:hypothetical protein